MQILLNIILGVLIDLNSFIFLVIIYEGIDLFQVAIEVFIANKHSLLHH
jgi:hypothetical protein